MKLQSIVRVPAIVGALMLCVAAIPARASGMLDGALPVGASTLARVGIPVLLPASVPDGYHVAVVRADPTRHYYTVLYADGTGTRAFAVSGATQIYGDPDSPQDQQRRRSLGVSVHSDLFGTVGVQTDLQCTVTKPVALVPHAPKPVTYEVEACRSLSPAEFAAVVGSLRRVDAFTAGGGTAPDPAAAMLAASQRARLRAISTPTVLFGYLPPGYRIIAFRSARDVPHGGPGGRWGTYTIRFGDGSGYIDLDVSTGGWGGADAPMQDISVPVHSRLLGETRLIHRPDSPRGCVIQKDDLFMLPLGIAGITVMACGVSPYEVKRALESARIVRP